MTMAIAFRVDGVPAPKGSYRIVGQGRRSALKSDNLKTKPWQTAVGWAARLAMGYARPLATAVRIDVEFFLPRPPSVRRGQPSVKPDIDKLTRSTLDGMTGIVYADDGQVVELHVAKSYADGTMPGASIVITEVA